MIAAELTGPWDDARVPPGYPRPQMVRADWRSLDGPWDYAIRDDAARPQRWDGRIAVPFSPESELSGVGRQVLPGQTLWYRRVVRLGRGDGRLLLHVGAADQHCLVYVNGTRAGWHSGGYWPFSLDVTPYVREGHNEILLAVRDDSDQGLEAYGKQRLARGGMWYTAQSGVWQTVWTETVPSTYIERVDLAPLPDESALACTVTLAGEAPGTATLRLDLPDPHPWSPDDPYLHGVRITAGEDSVETYAGWRTVGLDRTGGVTRFTLNGQPLFCSGLLDQGYYAGGLYTAPDDDAVVADLRQVKALGFNLLRKHVKIEPQRWYYHCDRLGLLVWQDLVSGGGPYSDWVTRLWPFLGVTLSDDGRRRFGRASEAGRRIFERDLRRTVALLRNHPSVVAWVPFNEGWGQFDANRIAEAIRALDPTRLVDHASGWHDQGGGDVRSWHVYYKPFRMRPDPRRRLLALTEVGGFGHAVPGHVYGEKRFGYGAYASAEEAGRAFARLYRRQVIPAVARGLGAVVYTQLSDVEDEVNGLVTYDRATWKLDPELVRAINRELRAAATIVGP